MALRTALSRRLVKRHIGDCCPGGIRHFAFRRQQGARDYVAWQGNYPKSLTPYEPPFRSIAFFCAPCIAPNVYAIFCPCQISPSSSKSDQTYSRKWPRFLAFFMARGSSASPRAHGRGVSAIREESMVLDTILLLMTTGVNDRNTYPGGAWMKHGRGLRRTNVCARLSGELRRLILWL